jgi:hypothetical protein
MPIVKLKEFKNRQAGIYVISPTDSNDIAGATDAKHPSPTPKPVGPSGGYAKDADLIHFKVGRTIQMNNRLNSYHLCFNEGFYIYKALMLNDTYDYKNKDARKICLAKTKEIEAHLFKLLEPINYTTTTRRKSEWFREKKTDTIIAEALIATHNAFKADTDYPIMNFSRKLSGGFLTAPNYFYNHFFIDDTETIIISLGITETPPSYLPQEGAKTRSGRVIKVSSKLKDVLHFDLKKKVSKSWS